MLIRCMFMILIYIMEARRYEQKLKLLLNQPSMLKHYLDRNNLQFSKIDKFKTIYPPTSQIDRFRHLEQARLSAQRDIELDGWVTELIGHFEAKVKENSVLDSKIQSKKDNTLGKLKMDYVEQQMSQNLIELQKLIKDYEYFGGLIQNQKGYVEKMIMMTEIRKAMTIQNSILKRQNEMLKQKQQQIDTLLASRKKK